MGHIFFSSADSHTKGLLEGVTEVHTDPKRRFVSFKVTPINGRFLSVYVPSWHNTWEQLAREDFFERVHNYLAIKSESNENKIILEYFNWNMNKIDRDGANET